MPRRGPPFQTSLEPVARIVQTARHSIGELGYVAATLAYLQATTSDRAQSKMSGDRHWKAVLEVNSQLYAQSLATQIASLLDNRRDALSILRLALALRNGGQAIEKIRTRTDRNHAKAGCEHQPERFDGRATFICQMIERFNQSDSLDNIRDFRNSRVAHLSLDDYRVSFEDFAEVSFDLINVGYVIQNMFCTDVDQRNLIDLYKFHLSAACKMLGIQKIEPLFVVSQIEFHVRQ